MPDSSMPDAKDQLTHLDRLFLIAQFLTTTADEAAGLVEATFVEATRRAATKGSSGSGSFSSLVELMMIQATGNDESATVVRVQQALSETVRRAAADDFLADRVRLLFLSMSDSERMALWACVETSRSEIQVAQVEESTEPDALNRFCEVLSALASPLESRVFEHHIVRSAVAGALRYFWETAFVPVPPTLRSVLESKLRTERRLPGPIADRQASPMIERKKTSRPARLLPYTLLIVLASGLAYLISQRAEPEAPSTNILELSLSSLDNVVLSFQTDNPEQIERLIFDRFGWRLTTPVIANATLEGLGLKSVTENIEVPVFIFSNDDDGATIRVVAYTYGFFERNRDRFALPSGTLRQIQQPAGFDIQEMQDWTAVVWRDRDDIFAAFVDEGGSDFRTRVSPGS